VAKSEAAVQYRAGQAFSPVDRQEAGVKLARLPTFRHTGISASLDISALSSSYERPLAKKFPALPDESELITPFT
jgi:hypothetical protein